MQRFAFPVLLVAAIIGCRDAGPTAQSRIAGLVDASLPYQAVDLGTLGGTSSVAADVNDNGQVVGSSATTSGASHAFIWQDGVITDLGTLGGESSEATEVNAGGQVAGWSADGAGEIHAFLWSDGVMQDLGPAMRFAPVRLNAGGEVTWSAPMPDGIGHAVLWTAGVVQDLGTLGPSGSQPRAINDRGQVIGMSDHRAFLWDGGVMQDLGDLGGGGWAEDINNQGQVVGASYTSGLEHTLHAILWDNGQMTDLGTVPGDANAQAVAINELGQVAGVSLDLAYERGKPFRWQAGVLLPLNPAPDGAARTERVSGLNQRGVVAGSRVLSRSFQAVVSENGARWELPPTSGVGTSASAINARGDVAGISGSDPSTQRAVLWRRVPTLASN